MLRSQHNIPYSEEELIFKFNSSLLYCLHREVELFDSHSPDKSFSRALAMECKLAPHMWSYQAHPSFASTPSCPQSQSSPMPYKWCSFHKSSFHDT